MFVWVFSVLHSYGDVTIVGEGLQNLTYMYAWHSWPLSNESSLTCHTHCDTGHLFIMVISKNRDNHTCCREFSSEAVSAWFFLSTYVCRGWNSNTQPSVCEATALTDCAHERLLWLHYYADSQTNKTALFVLINFDIILEIIEKNFDQKIQ